MGLGLSVSSASNCCELDSDLVVVLLGSVWSEEVPVDYVSRVVAWMQQIEKVRQSSFIFMKGSARSGIASVFQMTR
jgi:hypothetical protein